MKKASLITDGSCLGNPGPGGWACILRFGAIKKELFGYDAHTTNNRMELMAAIQGLLAFKEPCEVEITTDARKQRFPSPSSPGRAAFVMMGVKGDEEGFSDYRWIVSGESRPGRVGLRPAIRCNQEGTLWVRRSHYQQSNGVDGGDPGAPRVQGAVRSRDHDRRRVRSAGNHAVGDPMETSPLVEEEPPRSQRGPLDGTGRVGRDPQNELDLDQGTRRPRG